MCLNVLILEPFYFFHFIRAWKNTNHFLCDLLNVEIPLFIYFVSSLKLTTEGLL